MCFEVKTEKFVTDIENCFKYLSLAAFHAKPTRCLIALLDRRSTTDRQVLRVMTNIRSLQKFPYCIT